MWCVRNTVQGRNCISFTLYTSPYRSFNFQQLFFYDIFFRNAAPQRVFYELSVVKVYDSQPIFLLIFWHNKKKQVK